MITDKILQGEQMESAIARGVNTLANAVKTTLGPKGKNVLIKTGFGEIIATKDGVTVAREIRLKDEEAKIGADLVKSISVRVNDLAGDGTTSSIVLAQALFKAANKKGIKNVYRFQKRLKEDSEKLLKIIKDNSKPVLSSQDIYNIALVSSNNDEEIAQTFKNLYEKLGKNMTILVEEGNLSTEVKYTKGIRIENGFLSPYSVEDYHKLSTTFEKPLIFLFDGKLKNRRAVTRILQVIRNTERPVILFVDNIDKDALNIFAQYHINGEIKTAIVKNPGFSQRKLELMSDMALITGAKIYHENSDFKYLKESDLGEVDTAHITMGETILKKDKADKVKIKERIDEIKQKLDKGVDNDYEIRKMQERISNLDGGIAVVKVGAKTETERKELKDRFEDAKNAVLAATIEGVVEGGGISYLKALREVDKDFCSVLRAAVTAITETILLNAEDIPEQAKKKITSIIVGSKQGIDVDKLEATDTDMFSRNITDPYVVIKESLKSAVSVVGTLLTTKTLIINKDDGSGRIDFN